MISLASVAWLGLLCAHAVATRTGVRCENLDVRFKTLLEKGTKEVKEEWLRFNLFTEYCQRHPDMIICVGDSFTTDYTLEKQIWSNQTAILERIVVEANLSNVPLRLYFLYHVGHNNESVFLEVNKELFVVRKNGTTDYCLGQPEQRLEDRLRGCGACPRLLANRIGPTDISKKWLRLCQNRGRTGTVADPPKDLGFVCRERPRPVTTKPTTPRPITTETTAQITTESGGTSVEDSTSGDTKRAASTAGPVVVPVAVLAVLSAVAFVLFVWRARLVEAWKRFRGASAAY